MLRDSSKHRGQRAAFFRGVARVFAVDGMGLSHQIARTDAEAQAQDVRALRSDWVAVGDHIQNAMDTVGEELRKSGR